MDETVYTAKGIPLSDYLSAASLIPVATLSATDLPRTVAIQFIVRK